MKDSILRNAYRAITDVIFVALITFFTSFLGALLTVGASLTAAFFVMFKLMQQKNATYVMKDFKDSFVKNFVLSTIIWISSAILLLGLFFIYNFAINTGSTILLVSVYVAALEIILFLSYIFPIIAVFETPNTKSLIKNTILMMHGHISTSIKMLGTIIFIGFLVLRVHSAFILLGVPLYLYFNTFHLNKIFNMYKERIEGEKNELSQL